MRFTRSKRYRHKRRRTQRGGENVQEYCGKIYAAASAKDAEKEYRKGALKFHPDKGGNEEDFKALTTCLDRKKSGLGPAAAPAPQPKPAAPAPAPQPKPAAPAPAPQPKPAAPAPAPQPKPAAPAPASMSGERSALLALTYTGRKYDVMVRGVLNNIGDQVEVYSNSFNGIFRYDKANDGRMDLRMDLLELDGTVYKGAYIEHIDKHRKGLLWIDQPGRNPAMFDNADTVKGPPGYGPHAHTLVVKGPNEEEIEYPRNNILKIAFLKHVGGKAETNYEQNKYIAGQYKLMVGSMDTETDFVDLYDKKLDAFERYLVRKVDKHYIDGNMDKSHYSYDGFVIKFLDTNLNLENKRTIIDYSKYPDIYLTRMIASESIPRVSPEKPFSPASKQKDVVGIAEAGPTPGPKPGEHDATLYISYLGHTYRVIVRGDLDDIEDEVEVFNNTDTEDRGALTSGALAFNGTFKYMAPDDGKKSMAMDVLEVDGKKYKGQYVEHIPHHIKRKDDVNGKSVDILVVESGYNIYSNEYKRIGLAEIHLKKRLGKSFEVFDKDNLYYAGEVYAHDKAASTGQRVPEFTPYVYYDVYNKKTDTFDRYLAAYRNTPETEVQFQLDNTHTSSPRNPDKEYVDRYVSISEKDAVTWRRFNAIRLIASERVPSVFPDKTSHPWTKGYFRVDKGGKRKRTLRKKKQRSRKITFSY